MNMKYGSLYILYKLKNISFHKLYSLMKQYNLGKS